MNEELIRRHNELVKPDDMVYHLGDFSMRGDAFTSGILARLNGEKSFLRGSHDRWMKSRVHTIILEVKAGKHTIILCHYPLARWPKAHYNSWHLHGHCHGRFKAEGKILDVGVDCHDFYPVSLDRVVSIMDTLSDNPGLVRAGFSVSPG